jgi:hypothetical protein
MHGSFLGMKLCNRQMVTPLCRVYSAITQRSVRAGQDSNLILLPHWQLPAHDICVCARHYNMHRCLKVTVETYMFPKLTYNEKHSPNIYITIVRLNYELHLLQDDNATCCLMNNYSLQKHVSNRDCIAPESQEGHLKLPTLHD